MSNFWIELKRNVSEYPFVYEMIIICLAAIASIVADFVVKRILLNGLKKIFNSLPLGNKQANSLFISVAARLANIIPVTVLYNAIAVIPNMNPIVVVSTRRICIILMVIFVVISINRLLDLAEMIYQKRPYAASHPIKGYLQLAKIFFGIIAAILVISFILNKSPIILLSGLGAVAAVLMLVFQDTILSLVASVQLSSNNMVKIGDWIVMPSYGADGFVIEIALHTVKIQNWDKTIVTVPTRKLIEESFTNWRGMFESGGRRIKRSIYIDQRSIRFLTEDEIKRLEDFIILNEYLETKKEEISEWNISLAEKGAKPINSRRITNIGTFRVYVEKYLKSNKNINQEMIQLVRQLAPSTTGLPLEIYCFTKSTQWIEHEKVQSDIFDHLLAILPVFGLRVFQDCSDIYQEVSDFPTFVDGIFPQTNLVPPIYPSDIKRVKEIAAEYHKKVTTEDCIN